MKQCMLLLSVLFAFFSTSCRKNSIAVDNLNATIVGKWNIVNDATFTGVGVNNHPVNYAGKTGDYFDIRKDGYIYMKEGTTLDTSSYKLISDTTILTPSFGITLNGVTAVSHITKLSAHNATITAPTKLTPGGRFGRKVDLSR